MNYKLNRKFLYFSILLLLLCGKVFNQSTTIFQTGIVTSKLSPFLIYSTQYYGVKFMHGLNIGICKSRPFNFNSDFRFRYGAMFQRIGEKYKHSFHLDGYAFTWNPEQGPVIVKEQDISYKKTVHIDELKIPVLLEYHIDKFMITTGFNIGFILGGEAGKQQLFTKYNAGDPENSMLIKKMDYSVSLGCGYRYKNLGAHLIYNQGIRFVDNERFYSSLFEHYQKSPFENRYPFYFKGTTAD